MYFLNDYYPYRKLVEVYYRKRDNLNVINTVEEFFKSGRFCNESQVLWFESNYKKACTLYYETQQYEKVIKVAKEYFNSDARKTKSSPAWFNKKIAEASKKLDKSPVNESSNPIKTTNLSNDELLFKYADLYEKGLLTKYEFDRKKKELLFNDD